jgi:hypothetical protein
LNAAVRGLSLKVLMVVDEKPDWDFIAQPQIKTFAQLKGSAVGILSIGGTVAVVTREMLRRNNWTRRKTSIFWSWAATTRASSRSRAK